MNAQLLTTHDRDTTGTPATPTILVADSFSDNGVTRLRELGCNVHLEPSLDEATLPEAVRNHQPNAIIVRSTKVLKTVFEAAEHLGLVAWHFGRQLPRNECDCRGRVGVGTDPLV